jgi:hypothetical protein
MAQNHGHSPAAWTGVSIMLLGALAAGLGFVVEQLWLIIAGSALFLGGAIVGAAMSAAGLGSPRTPSHDPADLRERVENA